MKSLTDEALCEEGEAEPKLDLLSSYVFADFLVLVKYEGSCDHS